MSRMDFLEDLGKYGFHAINIQGNEVEQEILAVRSMVREPLRATPDIVEAMLADATRTLIK